MELPKSVRFVVIGAGVHGLSTAYHLAKELKARGEGSGEDILIVDKTGIAAGASGIACGVVRNNYYQPAMSELMAANVEVWESDPAAYHYNSVGYMALGPKGQESDLTEVAGRQERIGYEHTLVTGEADAAPTCARSSPTGARRASPSSCTSTAAASRSTSTRCTASPTRRRPRACASSTASPSPASTATRRAPSRRCSPTRARSRSSRSSSASARGCRRSGTMLGLPSAIDIRTPAGDVHKDQDMWTYWYLQEGEIAVDPTMFDRRDGSAPPVIHVDTDAPLHDDDGRLITDELWGIYYKRDRHGVQGGAAPLTVGPDFDVDPYPTASVDPTFPDMWCAALSHCMERFQGCRSLYKDARSGGAGAFTADNFPVFDYMRPNVYVIADSNHGYKMIGVGREVAKVVCGDHSSLLYPFRFERFATGDLHPVSNSPYPWS